MLIEDNLLKTTQKQLVEPKGNRGPYYLDGYYVLLEAIIVYV